MDKKTMIIEAYIRTTVSSGIRNSSMQAIAKAANVATGTVYTYFADKSELINESYRYVRMKTLDYAGAALEPDMDRHQKFSSLFGRLCDFFAHNPTYFEFSERFTYGPEISSESRQAIHGDYESYQRLLQEGIEQGELKDMDDSLMFRYLWGCAASFAHHFLRSGRDPTESEIAEYVEFMWDSIQA